MILLEIIAGILFVATSGLLFNEKFRRNRYLIGAAALIGAVSSWFLFLQISDLFTGGRSTPDAAASAPQRQAPDASRFVVNFEAAHVTDPPIYTVAAAPMLHSAPIAIDVVRMTPDTSRVVFRNNLGLYGGLAVNPTVSENFLTQVNVDRNAPSSFRLRLAEPVERISFVVPAIYPASPSGVTFPAWRATAYAPGGREVATVGEALTRRFADEPSQAYTLRAPDFEGIQEIEFESDWRGPDGVPFAGFEAILIEQITVQRRRD